jgi:hypothetical protein
MEKEGIPGASGKFRMRVTSNPARELASAWNIAAEAATGDVIGLVVAHSIIAPDYVTCAVKHLQEGVADAVGGPYRMAGKDLMGQAIAAAMSCPFGVGQSRYRYGGDVENIDSLANALYPTSLLRRFLPFDRTVGRGRGQDWEIHYRMRQAGIRLAQFADIRHDFYGRKSLWGLWQQYFTWAEAKVGMIRKHGLGAVRWTHFLPMAFVLWAVLGAIVGSVSQVGRWVWIGGLGLYGIALLSFSLLMAARRGWRLLWLLPVAFLSMHLAYGLGMLWNLTMGRRCREAG